MSENYLKLDADKIVGTIEKLQARIGERFPESGLYGASGQFLQVARVASLRAAQINRPNLWLRTASASLIVLIVLGIIAGIVAVDAPGNRLNFFESVQVLEAAINDVVLIGAGIFFLVTLELRQRRKATLEALHELRSLVHVVDMHQLTKDPEYLLNRGKPTASGAHIPMTAFELNRYLDYCSEMLSLIGKVAALYVQDFDDQVAVTAVNEIETLATGLSRKIWQKIVLIDQVAPPGIAAMSDVVSAPDLDPGASQ